MRVAITGGTGFVGRHLATRFDAADVTVLSRRTGADLLNVDALTTTFRGHDAIAHFAGINRQVGDQTYDRVHVQGTAAVVKAAKAAGVTKVVMLSFLRARPNCGSEYHESKWAAEVLIRRSGLDYTILKAGMIYGRGDHLVDHLSHTVQTLPLFASVGLHEKPIRPIPVEELVDIAEAAVRGRMSRETVAVVGAEELTLSEAVRRVSAVLGRRTAVLPVPVWAHYALGQLTEWTMKVPLVAKAQVRMLAEGVSQPSQVAGSQPVTSVPGDLQPARPFDEASIRAALPPAGGFGLADLRFTR